MFDTLVAACEVVNSKSCEVQCTEKVATVQADKVDELTIYLSEGATTAEIVTS